ncbi:hypothetical protein TKK_0007786 [Trichogramma kaykai]
MEFGLESGNGCMHGLYVNEMNVIHSNSSEMSTCEPNVAHHSEQNSTNSNTNQPEFSNIPVYQPSFTSNTESCAQGYTFPLVQNHLYFLLNSTFAGRLILDKYRLHQIIIVAELKVIIIDHYIQNDNVTYRITNHQFLWLLEQTKQLFPTIDGEEVILIPHACLTDENILDHKTTDIFNKWDEQFNKRFDWLMESTRKSYLHTVDGYYLKYKCLRSSIGIELLENDFLKIIDKFLKNQKPPSNINFEIYDELFICNWPTIASKIVTYCITSKIREVQDFKREHGIEIFDREKDNIIFALYLLPLCMTVIKKFPSESNTILVPKSKISQSFILFVKENEDLEAKITAHEDYLKSINQEIPAYLIFIGSYTQTSKYFLLLDLGRFFVTTYGPLYSLSGAFA